MPNGHELTDEEFSFLNGPLLEIDSVVSQFVEAVKGRIIYNYHARPERRIVLDSQDTLQKQITLSPVTAGGGSSSTAPHYSLTIWAFHDANGARTLWSKEIVRFSIDQMTSDSVTEFLRQAADRLTSIDISFVSANGRVSRVPT